MPVIISNERQRTIQHAVTFSGIALHTGNRVRLSVHAAGAGTGIRFRRVDLPGNPEIRGLVTNVNDTRRGTTITENGASVHTVEHLLAAVNVLGLDNLRIDMLGPEPPIGDGSAEPYVELLRSAGAVEQDAFRKYLVVERMHHIQMGDTHLVLLPEPAAFRITCTVKYHTNPLDCQFLTLEITEETFLKELLKARTFCLFGELEYLMKNNLIRGGSLDNAVVIRQDAIFSKEGLRYPDEFVRHKMMDMVGDLFLLGLRLKGHVIAVKPGHPSNVELAKKLVAEEMGG